MSKEDRPPFSRIRQGSADDPRNYWWNGCLFTNVVEEAAHFPDPYGKAVCNAIYRDQSVETHLEPLDPGVVHGVTIRVDDRIRHVRADTGKEHVERVRAINNMAERIDILIGEPRHTTVLGVYKRV